MKKFIFTVFLAICGIILSVCSFAQGSVGEGFQTLKLLQNGDFPESTSEACLFSTSTAKDYIKKQLALNTASIDISSHNVAVADLAEIVQDIVNSSPELFNVSSGYRYYYSGSKVTKLIPDYCMTAAQYKDALAVYESGIDDMVSGVNDSMSDVEKILSVHDYIVSHYGYDTSYTIYDAYNFISSGKGVCQSYTLCFIGAMNRLGIDVSFATSPDMNHIWNVVKVGESWFHVDATWDDPTYDRYGLVNHTFFLLDDDTISSTAYSTGIHHDWSSAYACADTSFVNFIWVKSNAPFVFSDGDWYFINNQTRTIDKANLSLGSSVAVTAFNYRWTVFGNDYSYYNGVFSGFFTDGQKLYCNSKDSILCFDPHNSSLSVLGKVPTEQGYIYGTSYDGKYIGFSMQTSPSSADRTIKYFHESPEEFYISSSDVTKTATGLHFSSELFSSFEDSFTSEIFAAFYKDEACTEFLCMKEVTVTAVTEPYGICDLAFDVVAPTEDYGGARLFFFRDDVAFSPLCEEVTVE